MRQPYSINVFLYCFINDQPNYLLLQRTARLGLPEFWQGITGALEDDDSYIQAAAREVLEETGLSPNQFFDVNHQYSYAIKDEWRCMYGDGPTEIVEKVFCAEVFDIPQLSDEHCGFRWCSKAEALELLSFEDNKQALLATDRFITIHGLNEQ